MPRLPDCRIVGKELTFVFPSNGDALVGYRMIRDAVDAAEKAVAPPAPDADFLEVGAEYFDRRGKVWAVTGYGPCNAEYPYRAQTTSPDGRLIEERFRGNGRYYPTFEHHYDLVKRVGAAPKTDPAPKPPLTFRVGGEYRDRKDSAWTVEDIGGAGRYPIRARRSDGQSAWFTAEGLRSPDEKRAFDLIEEIAPPPCPTLHDCRAGQTVRCTCCDKEG